MRFAMAREVTIGGGEKAIYHVRGFWLMGVITPLALALTAYEVLVTSSYMDQVIVVYVRLGLAFLAFWLAQAAIKAWQERHAGVEAAETDAEGPGDLKEVAMVANEQRRLFRFSFLLTTIVLLLQLPLILSSPQLRLLPWESPPERRSQEVWRKGSERITQRTRCPSAS